MKKRSSERNKSEWNETKKEETKTEQVKQMCICHFVQLRKKNEKKNGKLHVYFSRKQ